MNLINKKLLAQKVENFKNFPDGARLENDKKIVDGWIKSLTHDNLDNTKEKSVEKSFLIRFFSDILGYDELGSISDTSNLYPDYTIEKSAGSDTLYADGALGFFSKDRNVVKAVIELKDALTPLDKKQSGREKGYTPVGQAFQYAQKIDGCNWIIVSNFKEIRLYNKQRSDELYEAINVLELANPENFKRFYYLLCRENLICEGPKSVIDSVLMQSVENDEDITKKFYAEYKVVRVKFFEHLQKHNPNLDKHTLLEKTQKLLDRFIFVLFCEDTNGLLPLNISKQTYELGKKSRERSDQKIWREFRNLFMDIDEGRIDVDPQINKYNGGLFRKDEALDAMSIKDEIWEELMRLTRWDFDSELNVNILGHIFEQSISDLETLRAEISGEQVDKSKSKRKKEGVYYTPEYITKYIVENTVGRWLEENPDKLENVTILDPACGSGAFLNQAHSYLMKQFKLRNEEAMLNSKGKMQLFNYHVAETTILSKNLYGVDLNEESVEITKLSLWLKTATKSEPLQNLDNNIKCGNSLIDDPAVAGQKAFKWEAEFKEVLGAGGFDVVVSNPPYGAENENFTDDSYILFYKKALSLLKKGGFLGFITPDTWTININGKSLREIIKEDCQILDIYDVYKPFEDAKDVWCHIVILKKREADNNSYYSVKRCFPYNLNIFEFSAPQNELPPSDKSWNIYINPKLKYGLFKKLNSVPRANIYWNRGISPTPNNLNLTEKGTSMPVVGGEDIYQYGFKWHEKYLVKDYSKSLDTIAKIQLNSKLVIQRIRTNSLNFFSYWLISTFVEKEYIPIDSLGYLLQENASMDIRNILAIINSKLMNFYYKLHFTDKNVKPIYLNDLPIIQFQSDQHILSELVNGLLSLNSKIDIWKNNTSLFLYNEYKAKIELSTDSTWDLLMKNYEKQKIHLNIKQKEELMSWYADKLKALIDYEDDANNIKKEIDQEIYKLYGLTPDEIKIVEDGTA